MELWDIVDEYRKNTGKTHVRGNEMEVDAYHNVVHLWLLNEKNEVLIQRRQPFKKGFSGMWDCTLGGSATAGDTSVDAVIRECEEEIGLKITEDEIEKLFTVKFGRGFDDVWFCRKEVNVQELVLQYEEVAEVKWATMDEIREMIIEGKFIAFKYIDYLDNLINSDIQIRLATEKDYEELYNIRKEAFKPVYDIYEDDDFSPYKESFKKFEKRNLKGDCYFLDYKGKAVGCILIIEIEPGCMQLSNIAILPDYNGKGIAKYAIERMELMHPEILSWKLDAIKDYSRSANLYSHMGYRIVGKERKLTEKLTLIDMEKRKNIKRIEAIL